MRPGPLRPGPVRQVPEMRVRDLRSVTIYRMVAKCKNRFALVSIGRAQGGGALGADARPWCRDRCAGAGDADSGGETAARAEGADGVKYISIRIRPDRVFHGYDENRTLIVDKMPASAFVEKVIKIERILSVTEDYIFIETPHDTVQTWEYEGDLAEIKRRLAKAGVLID